MPELFRRAWGLRIGTRRISGVVDAALHRRTLDCTFEVEKSTAREPNKATIQVWNLSPATRDVIHGAGSDTTVSLEAGYVDATDIIYSGDVRLAYSQPDGVDVVTTIESEDGGTAYRGARVNRSFPAGTPVLTVLRACITALGVGRGNLSEVESDGIEIEGGGSAFTEGTVLSGPASRELDRIVRSCGLSWSIQNGAIQFRRGSGPVRARAIVLSPSTGLVESPTPATDRQGLRVGRVTCQTLLIPGLYPGRIAILQSRLLEGQYQIVRVRYSCDTAGTGPGSWNAELTLEEY